MTWQRPRKKNSQEGPTSQDWQNSLLNVLDGVEGKRNRDCETLEQVRSTLRKELSLENDKVSKSKQKPTLETCNIFGKPLIRVKKTEDRMTGRSKVVHQNFDQGIP